MVLAREECETKNSIVFEDGFFFCHKKSSSKMLVVNKKVHQYLTNRDSAHTLIIHW